MPTADLIFKNADVITVDAGQPSADFVAVKGDKILFAGSKDFLTILPDRGPDSSIAKEKHCCRVLTTPTATFFLFYGS